jgi:dCMP deaminase
MANWDKRFMDMARHVAAWSKDKSTKLGAVIVDDENTILSIGYNGFPRGSNDNIEERYERPQKYLYTEHAERNAIYNAVRHGVSLKGSTIYVPMFPCVDCARGIINSGIKRVITYEPNFNDERWGDSFKVSHQLFEECGIKTVYFSDEYDQFYKNLEYSVALEWNKKGVKSDGFFGTQKDWNQTLITTINQASVNIIKRNLKSEANKIRCGNYIFSIIDDFEFFNKSTMMVANKYHIILDNNIPVDELVVYYDGRDGATEKEEKFNYILIKISNYN